MSEKNHICNYLKNSLSVFLILNAFSIPFTWALFPWHDDLTTSIFLYPVKVLSQLLNYPIVLEDFSSDTRALLLLLVFNILLAFLLTLIIVKVKDDQRISKFINLILTYYLAIILLKYGFDKLFKAQFYLPEPNLLYTPLGQLDKDLLYWSTMGTSRSYNVFMGLAEIIPGLLMLFQRTRIAGLLISLGVLINVVAVNFSFDISVKVFSCFLLMINIYLLFPSLRILWDVLILQRTIQLNKIERKSAFSSKWIKPILLVLISVEVLFPYIKTSNFNDDSYPRPYLHGAYENVNSDSDIKRIYIHRNGYLIFEDKKNNFVDYKMEIKKSEVITITDYDLRTQEIQFHFNAKSGKFILFPKSKKEMSFTSLTWKSLPLLQNKWHLTVD